MSVTGRVAVTRSFACGVSCVLTGRCHRHRRRAVRRTALPPQAPSSIVVVLRRDRGGPLRPQRPTVVDEAQRVDADEAESLLQLAERLGGRTGLRTTTTTPSRSRSNGVAYATLSTGGTSTTTTSYSSRRSVKRSLISTESNRLRSRSASAPGRSRSKLSVEEYLDRAAPHQRDRSPRRSEAPRDRARPGSVRIRTSRLMT